MTAQNALPVKQYVIAINSSAAPPQFLALIEKFAPRFALFGHVYILYHRQEFSSEQLKELVEPTLPPDISFYVGVLHDGIHTPPRERQS
jgi:hypothetical protein